jgi:uncharacterized protein (DUF2147 family)
MKQLVIAVCMLLCAPLAMADITGKWRTVDDETGQPKSIVEIFERGGRYHGRVVKLLPGATTDTCDKCSGDLAGKPILGMQVITGLVKKDEMYEGGQILDPKTGKVYDCKIWEEGGKLMVRGYLGFFYRTQTWQRAN